MYEFSRVSVSQLDLLRCTFTISNIVFAVFNNQIVVSSYSLELSTGIII
jgi:hypothetical protein